MGLFDVFSKGGKYFGKAIEPKCEYCDYGKRSSDGNKVLCTKKGMVDAGYHCPKFLYSPLKRIPVKQLERVGWLEGDYDEKDDEAIAKKAAEQKAANDAAPAPAPANAPAPAPASAPAPAAAPVAAQPTPKTASAMQQFQNVTAPAAGGNLAALAAMAEAAGDYQPQPEAAPGQPAAPAAQDNPAANGLSSM